jgi:phenylalanyl-tRNA synthetase beta chain
MKVSYGWLRSLVPALDASAEELAERLTRAGLEVEELSTYGAASRDVVVAEVRRVERHPSREKLNLVTVDRGGAELTVVCGAPNVPAPGGRVALAAPGTTLPAVGMTMTERDFAGVKSAGMLCSEVELGLVGAAKGDGILVLADRQAALGAPLATALPATFDRILDVSVTPNRPDALGHVGVARELAALYEVDFAPPEADAPAKVASGRAIAELCSVHIDDTERCPHYGAAAVVDVAVAASPDWARFRLESLGVRAINNVVDVTNLVMLEFGYPMHAFDLDRLPKGRIVVRRAKDGEVLTTLDGVERRLSDDDLLITDGERGVALAGVMGGANTEIGPETRRVLFECAYFTPRGIRRTSRRHGLHSESSHRFERGCDPEALPVALAHAAALTTRLSGGAAVPGLVLAGVPPAPRRRIVLRQRKMDALLGLAVPMARASAILTRLGCDVAAGSAGDAVVTAPSFRPDLGREEDLIEEVMRVNGIDAVPATPRALVPSHGRSVATTEDRARKAAAELGLSEALCFGFVAPAALAALSAPAPSVRLRNPLSEERCVMRTSLLPGLIEALGRARRHGVNDVRLFTVGRTFLAGGTLPRERLELAAILAGTRRTALEAEQPLDVYDAKGVAEELVARVSGRSAEVSLAPAPHLHPRASARVTVDGAEVGRLGPLHPAVLDAFDLGASALVVELDLDALEALGRVTPQCRPIPTLPPVTRDLALVVSDDVSAARVTATIRGAAGELCESVSLFDLFRGKGVPDDHRSLAFHLVFRDPRASSDPERARTLTDEEVDAVTARVVDAAKSELGATLR